MKLINNKTVRSYHFLKKQLLTVEIQPIQIILKH